MRIKLGNVHGIYFANYKAFYKCYLLLILTGNNKIHAYLSLKKRVRIVLSVSLDISPKCKVNCVILLKLLAHTPTHTHKKNVSLALGPCLIFFLTKASCSKIL